MLIFPRGVNSEKAKRNCTDFRFAHGPSDYGGSGGDFV